MEFRNIFDGSLSRGKNQRLNCAKSVRNTKAIRLGGSAKRSWRFRVIPKLRMKIVSPVKLWSKLKGAYINMTLHAGGNGNVFGGKRIPKARQAKVAKFSNSEFDNRLIYEIYKSVMPSMELHNF